MIEAFDAIRHTTMISIVLRFSLACLFGGIIGLERGRKQQAAGLRTHMMVCIGSASTMIVSEYMAYAYNLGGDIFRLSAQVISGIGFLGAGTIIVTSKNRVRGLTTAASLWASACMGLVIGSGFYEAAIVMMAVMLFVLIVLDKYDKKYVKSITRISLFIEMENDVLFSLILQNIKMQGWRVQNIQKLDFLSSNVLSVSIDILSEEKSMNPVFSLDGLKCIEGVHYIEVM